MRITHRQNPFHRIECWTGTHFRRAELWEVGTYLLVQHQTDQPICNALRFQIKYLETFEDMKDKAEQESAHWQADDRHRPCSHYSASAPYCESAVGTTESTADETAADDNIGGDTEFFHRLEALWHQEKGNVDIEDSLQDFFDGDDEREVEQADEDIQGFQPYLPDPMEGNQRVEQHMRTDADASIMLPTADAERTTALPTADALNNSYIRVVHTNGIHHLAMVACHCQGEQQISLDLVTSNLLPTSFTKIRTLFTVQVLDHFRLCNLELKASAYQFYQLIRRITSPLRPAEVVNLYHELRRMSRLWRWMKRLKWAGYGHNQKDPLNPEPGSLTNYCPACPQVGINIPENWKDDVNRWVTT
jgi:CxC2 like cysteine cluster associated with KDZ transposases